MLVDYLDWAHAILELSTPVPRPRHVERLAGRLEQAGLTPGGEPYSAAVIAADFGRDDHSAVGDYTLDPRLAVRALLQRVEHYEAEIRRIGATTLDKRTQHELRELLGNPLRARRTRE